jgi:NTE family protein
MSKRGIIKNLALCGGGFFGYAEVGALVELDKYKEFFNIESVYGVSVGSMVAALYAVGYTPIEIKDIMFDLNFSELIMDGIMPYLRFYDKYGMYEAVKLEEKMEQLIRSKTNIKFCTFSQININLNIISTNLNYQCARYFNKEDTPNMVISKAVRMSIGYPPYITPVEFEGDLYGDGGEFMNYPIILIENLDETIGISFASYNENPDGTLKRRIPINNVYDYIRSLGMTITRSTYVSQIKQCHLDRSIIVNITRNVASMELSLNEDDKKFIFECGIQAVKDQIDKLLGVKN